MALSLFVLNLSLIVLVLPLTEGRELGQFLPSPAINVTIGDSLIPSKVCAGILENITDIDELSNLNLYQFGLSIGSEACDNYIYMQSTSRNESRIGSFLNSYQISFQDNFLSQPGIEDDLEDPFFSNPIRDRYLTNTKFSLFSLLQENQATSGDEDPLTTNPISGRNLTTTQFSLFSILQENQATSGDEDLLTTNPISDRNSTNSEFSLLSLLQENQTVGNDGDANLQLKQQAMDLTSNIFNVDFQPNTNGLYSYGASVSRESSSGSLDIADIFGDNFYTFQVALGNVLNNVGGDVEVGNIINQKNILSLDTSFDKLLQNSTLS